MTFKGKHDKQQRRQRWDRLRKSVLDGLAERDWSQRRLATEIGIGKSAIHSALCIERQGVPSDATMDAIVDKLEIEELTNEP